MIYAPEGTLSCKIMGLTYIPFFTQESLIVKDKTLKLPCHRFKLSGLLPVPLNITLCLVFLCYLSFWAGAAKAGGQQKPRRHLVYDCCHYRFAWHHLGVLHEEDIMRSTGLNSHNIFSPGVPLCFRSSGKGRQKETKQ